MLKSKINNVSGRIQVVVDLLIFTIKFFQLHCRFEIFNIKGKYNQCIDLCPFRFL